MCFVLRMFPLAWAKANGSRLGETLSVDAFLRKLGKP